MSAISGVGLGSEHDLQPRGEIVSWLRDFRLAPSISRRGAGTLLCTSLVAVSLTACAGGLGPAASLALPPPAEALGTPVEEPGDITLAFAGDVHWERSSRTSLDRNAPEALGPFAKKVLSRADLAVVNLETAVTDGGIPQPKAYRFRAPASAFEAFRGAGIDVASMANNHALDYGTAGLHDSLAAAQAAGYPVIGLGPDEAAAYAPYKAVVKGRRIAVLAATTVIDAALVTKWTATPSHGGVASGKRLDRLTQAVREAKADADIVVLFMHWGQEENGCPTATQRELTDAVVTAGADIVVGSHAHWLLGGGWHPSGAYVDYGLGNFAFYATGMGRSTESGVLTLTVSDTKVSAASWTPARIRDGIPVTPTRADATAILDRKERARVCTKLSAARP